METMATRVRELERMGFAAFEAGRYGEAEEAFRWAAVAAPEDPDAWIGLGSALAKQGRNEEAALVFAMGAVAAPDDAWPVLLAAEAHMAVGERAKARDALDWVEALAGHGKVDPEQQEIARGLLARVVGREAP